MRCSMKNKLLLLEGQLVVIDLISKLHFMLFKYALIEEKLFASFFHHFREHFLKHLIWCILNSFIKWNIKFIWNECYDWVFWMIVSNECFTIKYEWKNWCTLWKDTLKSHQHHIASYRIGKKALTNAVANVTKWMR